MLIAATEVVFISDVVGRGVVATEYIPRGTVTWVRTDMDREFHPSELSALPAEEMDELLTYCYRTASGNLFLCGDKTRYINHSFDANCYLTPYGFEIAVRDIHPGEELTNDYGFFNILEPFEPDCVTAEREAVFPDDLLRYSEQWDQKISDAFSHLPQVQQPLMELIEPSLWKKCLHFAAGKEKPLSVRSLSFF